MTTHQLYLNQEDAKDNASGVAVIFFLLGAPNIYGILRHRSHTAELEAKGPNWTLGLGILAFALAGAGVCLSALG